MSSLYGKEGRDQKKIDTKTLLLDFSVLNTHFSSPEFIEQLETSKQKFLDYLNSTSSSEGTRNFYCVAFSFEIGRAHV